MKNIAKEHGCLLVFDLAYIQDKQIHLLIENYSELIENFLFKLTQNRYFINFFFTFD